ncbi:uridine diphosphate-N-acetylglucosamine-binding protein YvcK [Halobacillus litoralis]|uniref:Gluconeogenesis factor n=1 Tax=Halobacillus litoralis TaxID=45668 RepID=A0A845DV85_9BACI|nr:MULTISPECIES: YvcK family protein [Halobacillus]MCA1021340.1 YvcK family protein [Halobacillus litoralis]MYL21028.1 uridine diphosphate-N-acetylglucosamine-binding protein YvcK [Halobacillus litoralis]MYL31433.1 uridine diphosphate-N-acetylglucosamine-binding protein YvcK [Halobacillus halophilus]MYL38412.1 uridine diphosphate-N-acetylglucosamine-binding protein YvcK [Halobacillus litoralis]
MDSKTKPRVVVIGGGTGMPVLLRGLKKLPVDLSAIVTVADDGGSSGRLRTEMAIPAPGDIRNVVAALSDAEPMLLDLFQHRFSNGNGLSGHSMGNLLLAAMASMTGDFYKGIKEISRVLNVRGNIYPIANHSMNLHAEMEDGTIVTGESSIPKQGKKIKRVFVSPTPVQPLPEAVDAIQSADLIVIAPGSLYTSILPNIIIPEIGHALKETKAKVTYICNVMTQEGETSGYSAGDHIQALVDHIGRDVVQSVIVHNRPIDQQVRKKYAEENAEPVVYDIDRIKSMGVQVIEEDIIDHDKVMLRHDTAKLARLLHSML